LDVVDRLEREGIEYMTETEIRVRLVERLYADDLTGADLAAVSARLLSKA
jgi:hypothetical protein